MPFTRLLPSQLLSPATVAIATTAWVAMGFPIDSEAAAPNPDAATITAAQAAYSHNCLQCHGASLEGGEFGPPLRGTAFADKWSVQPPDALSLFITSRMPPSGPGTLSTQSYAGIEAYIRQQNGGLVSQVPDASASGAAGKGAVGKGGAANRASEEAERAARLFSTTIEPDATYKAVMASRGALLQAMSPVSEQLLRNPPEGDWLHWRRTYAALGFSPLAQIDKSNVRALRAAWSWTLAPSVNEITPMVHDGILFVASGNSIEALNATTGERLWQYLRALPETADGGRSSRMKSMAFLDDKLYAPTADGHVVALNARTGKFVWDHEVIIPEQGPQPNVSEGSSLRLDSGPLAVHGKIILGVSLGVTLGHGGAYVVALDARSGNEVWRFNTVAQPGQPGGDSWNGHPPKERYGGGVWMPGSYDPESNLVYFGTGNTYATATLLVPNPTERPENLGLYTDSTLALDADTGKLKWYYQHLGRDVWDLDWAFEQSLLSLSVDGQPHKLLITGGKLALFDALDSATGRYVFSRDMGLQNVVQKIDPKTGRKYINPAVQPEAGVAKLVCPYNTTGRNWPATAINPQSGVLYVPLAESCMNFTFTPGSAADTAAGGVDSSMVQRVRPDGDGNFGRLQAVDLKSGKVLWMQRQRATLSSAVLSTAGGLVFAGDHDRHFRAYDDLSGAILWDTRLNAPPASFPITYSVKGEQYVAVVAGAGNAMEATRAALTPEIDTPSGNPVLVVFKLGH